MAQRLQGMYGNRALVAFGFRHRLLNINSITLAQLAAGNSQLPLVMVPREVLDDSVDGYRSWLHSGNAGTACLLYTASGVHLEAPPLVTASTMAEAAVAEGFQATNSWPLPDGRMVTEWQRPQTCPA
jgi:hypothetical protein